MPIFNSEQMLSGAVIEWSWKHSFFSSHFVRVTMVCDTVLPVVKVAVGISPCKQIILSITSFLHNFQIVWFVGYVHPSRDEHIFI